MEMSETEYAAMRAAGNDIPAYGEKVTYGISPAAEPLGKATELALAMAAQRAEQYIRNHTFNLFAIGVTDKMNARGVTPMQETRTKMLNGVAFGPLAYLG